MIALGTTAGVVTSRVPHPRPYTRNRRYRSLPRQLLSSWSQSVRSPRPHLPNATIDISLSPTRPRGSPTRSMGLSATGSDFVTSRGAKIPCIRPMHACLAYCASHDHPTLLCSHTAIESIGSLPVSPPSECRVSSSTFCPLHASRTRHQDPRLYLGVPMPPTSIARHAYVPHPCLGLPRSGASVQSCRGV